MWDPFKTSNVSVSIVDALIVQEKKARGRDVHKQRERCKMTLRDILSKTEIFFCPKQKDV